MDNLSLVSIKEVENPSDSIELIKRLGSLDGNASDLSESDIKIAFEVEMTTNTIYGNFFEARKYLGFFEAEDVMAWAKSQLGDSNNWPKVSDQVSSLIKENSGDNPSYQFYVAHRFSEWESKNPQLKLSETQVKNFSKVFYEIAHMLDVWEFKDPTVPLANFPLEEVFDTFLDLFFTGKVTVEFTKLPHGTPGFYLRDEKTLFIDPAQNTGPGLSHELVHIWQHFERPDVDNPKEDESQGWLVQAQLDTLDKGLEGSKRHYDSMYKNASGKQLAKLDSLGKKLRTKPQASASSQEKAKYMRDYVEFHVKMAYMPDDVQEALQSHFLGQSRENPVSLIDDSELANHASLALQAIDDDLSRQSVDKFEQKMVSIYNLSSVFNSMKEIRGIYDQNKSKPTLPSDWNTMTEDLFNSTENPPANGKLDSTIVIKALIARSINLAFQGDLDGAIAYFDTNVMSLAQKSDQMISGFSTTQLQQLLKD